MYRQPSTTLQNSTTKRAGQNPESISKEAIYHLSVYESICTILYTLSGRLGKVGRLQDGTPAVAEQHRFIECNLIPQRSHHSLRSHRSGGTAHESGGCDQSIGSTVSDAIVHSWLWSTATRSSPLGYFCNYCKSLIIDPTFCGSGFSTGWVLAIEGFMFFSWDTSQDFLKIRSL